MLGKVFTIISLVSIVLVIIGVVISGVAVTQAGG